MEEFYPIIFQTVSIRLCVHRTGPIDAGESIHPLGEIPVGERKHLIFIYYMFCHINVLKFDFSKGCNNSSQNFSDCFDVCWFRSGLVGVFPSDNGQWVSLFLGTFTPADLWFLPSV